MRTSIRLLMKPYVASLLTMEKALLQHLGRMGRDRPADQLKAVEAILRISRQQGALGNECCAALGAIPGDEVNPPAGSCSNQGTPQCARHSKNGGRKALTIRRNGRLIWP